MATARPSVADKRRTFRTLHQSGCFVIPNPWSVGTAVYLQGLGFKALASTSSGFAHSLGLPDSAVSCDVVLEHLREIAHFYVGTQLFFTAHKTDVLLGKLLLQALHECNGWILRLTDAEDDFVLGILLLTVATKTLIHPGIDTSQRLED